VLLVIALVVIAAVPGGLVGAAVATAYGVAALRAAHHRAGRERSAESRRELLDRLGAAAADLRAGVTAATALRAGAPAATALLPPATGDPGPEQDPEQGRDPLRSWVGVAVALAERTGAPLAEVLERLEADGRATDRARSAAAAQAAGSQATAWLLSGLPVGGIALGYAIGADPLAVLFRTPVGAGCALGAVALQLAGLAWCRRITRQDEVAG
jgi:tight adherence protein B